MTRAVTYAQNFKRAEFICSQTTKGVPPPPHSALFTLITHTAAAVINFHMYQLPAPRVLFSEIILVCSELTD
jgi:hypothetical protein